MWIKTRVLWLEFKTQRSIRRNERLMRKWGKLLNEIHEMVERPNNCPYYNKNTD